MRAMRDNVEVKLTETNKTKKHKLALLLGSANKPQGFKPIKGMGDASIKTNISLSYILGGTGKQDSTAT
ncbi:hypothetical protein NIES4071_81620 [Calothrix sp. NIES-4071]|nr:hypothetical protein NIES4071_81620 [Calothrix sp. NIES-4071]BAZ62431.1 hypothetical protein NIES4105_81550 [Calothrix sp. NIES-4105]